MSELLSYYESELRFIREMGAEFAREHPDVAARLHLEENACRDPHVEHLIQAFAFLSGRIRRKLDEDFPEISESLLNILYPHYLRPVPSMAVAQFGLDPAQRTGSGGHTVPRHSELRTRNISEFGTHCAFKTCYPLRVWPLEVAGASMLPPDMFPTAIPSARATTAIRIELRCFSGLRIGRIGLDRLRFFLDGDASLTHTLYELIFNNRLSVHLTAPSANNSWIAVDLSHDCIEPVGFGEEHSMLPRPQRSFAGYTLLQEYFSFPRKFLFFDVAGFEKLNLSDFAGTAELLILIGEFDRRERLSVLQQSVRPETFRLGCVPIINLFERTAEPIRLNHTRTEYRVVPDVHLPNATEVYSIESVTSAKRGTEYNPFYALRHNYQSEPSGAYWHASRRASEREGDSGTEVYLSLVNLDFHPSEPGDDALNLRVTCTNRDAAGQLRLRHEFGELYMEFSPMLRLRFLHKPTTPSRPPLRSDLQWRLISHLALNHLSLGGNGADENSSEALREILRLYNSGNDPVVRKQIDGIVSIHCAPHLAPVTAPNGIAFALGLQANIEFDDSQYPGGGVFLFASVLERFLSLYGALNSFTQLTALLERSGRKEVLKKWKPRAGQQILL